MAERNKIGIMGWLLGMASILFALALLLSCTALFVSPSTFWPMQFLGIAFPYLFIINGVFFVYWVLRWRKFALYAFIGLAVGLILIPRYYGISKDSSAAEKELKFMSYNVHVFGKWSESEAIRKQILTYIAKQDPEVLCMQEFYSKVEKGFDNISILQNQAGYKHHLKLPYYPNRKRYYIATFSKHPILDGGSIRINDFKKNFCVYTDIELEDNTRIRVYNVHLKSLNINSEEYLFSGELDLRNEQDARKVAQGTKSIIRNMKRAFALRAKQVEAIQKHAESSPYPVVIAGDFNDTPLSYAYQSLRENRADAFVESGRGFSETYVGKFPSFRIDYILHDDVFTSSKYTRGKVEYSDHHPIYCTLGLDEIK